jgi:hypothetical protein
MAERLVEYHIPVSRVALLQLLLKIATSVLVLAEREKLALEVFDAHASEAVDYGSAGTRVELTFSVGFSTLVLQADRSTGVQRARPKVVIVIAVGIIRVLRLEAVNTRGGSRKWGIIGGIPHSAVDRVRSVGL